MRRREFKVTLRVLMLLVLGLAVALGGLFNQVRLERRAVAWVQRRGGSVGIQQPSGPPWMGRLLGGDPPRRVVSVGLTRLPKEESVVNEGMARIGSLRHLTHLDLTQSAVDDAGLERLAGCERLEHLVLSRTAVGDAGMAHLGDLPCLKTLILDDAAVSDAGWPRWAGRPN